MDEYMFNYGQQMIKRFIKMKFNFIDENNINKLYLRTIYFSSSGMSDEQNFVIWWT